MWLVFFVKYKSRVTSRLPTRLNPFQKRKKQEIRTAVVRISCRWRRKRDSFLSFAKQPWSAIFMLCKSLRAAAKNDAPCRFLNALVRIPLIKYRKTKRTSKKCLSVLLAEEEDSFNSGASEFTHISEASTLNNRAFALMPCI